MGRYICTLAVILIMHADTLAQVDNGNWLTHRALLAQSDSLFALGVDLFSAGKYEEAIPIFAKSDKIDKAVLNSTSNRRDYSSMWLAACLYQLGDTIEAAKTHDYYCYAPVDRRLTVKSDSLSEAGLLLFEKVR